MSQSSAKILWALGLSAFTSVACSGGGGGSPTSPSTLGTPGVATTIRGTTQASSTPQAASARICVSGTPACSEVDGSGNFTLTGDFAGNVQLHFTSPGGTGTSTIPDVKRGETIVVSLNLSAANGPAQIISRSGGSDSPSGPSNSDPADDPSEDTPDDDDPAGDDDSDDEDPAGDPADNDSEDDDPADDDPADNDSEDDDPADDPADNDSEDDDSADDDPADDDSEDDDSADDDPADDDSEDDDSADDDPADDDSEDDDSADDDSDDDDSDDDNRSGPSPPNGSQRRRG